jgi:hypothetical protein
MSSKNAKRLRKLIREGSSAELGEAVSTGQVSRRQFNRALSNGEHVVDPSNPYIPPKGYFNKGPDYYNSTRKVESDIEKMYSVLVDNDLETDVTIDGDATSVL